MGRRVGEVGLRQRERKERRGGGKGMGEEIGVGDGWRLGTKAFPDTPVTGS